MENDYGKIFYLYLYTDTLIKLKLCGYLYSLTLSSKELKMSQIQLGEKLATFEEFDKALEN
ncbi:hypothetical protein BpHYR1_039681 [Brachionus plicatilis]|uniref:Uncharacterized protein n=1 Tax=Brachionus plicatilis TaxID=10195 RepID=A0A3M7RC77_BRAPC|nr:hypothetical protein BpHYR1_039681 [Brachionus plicatilis]